VKYDPAGITPVALISLNGWKLSLKTDYEDVSCFGDTNKTYVPGLRDISGSLSGFWNSANVVIFTATAATTPGKLELAPNSTEPTFKFSGLAYLDADLDCSMAAPKVTSTFRAAGPWVEAP
jgi:hypothetical protein